MAKIEGRYCTSNHLGEKTVRAKSPILRTFLIVLAKGGQKIRMKVRYEGCTKIVHY